MPSLPSCLRRHAVPALFIQRFLPGVEQPVARAVGKTAHKVRAGGLARGALEGREGTRVEGLVVPRFTFQGPRVLPLFRWAVFLDVGKIGVHGVPDVVLSRVQRTIHQHAVYGGGRRAFST